MNKADLLKMIDKLVESRLNKILKSEAFSRRINEAVGKQLLNLIVESNGKQVQVKRNPLPTNGTNNTTSIKKKERKYTDDNIINKILNETTSDISPDYGSLNESEYSDSGNAFSDIIKNEMNAVNAQPAVPAQVMVNEQNGKELPDHLVNAFTQNYSSKLKDMDEKAKKYRTGGASGIPSTVPNAVQIDFNNPDA